jgi:hypothetical protein
VGLVGHSPVKSTTFQQTAAPGFYSVRLLHVGQPPTPWVRHGVESLGNGAQ